MCVYISLSLYIYIYIYIYIYVCAAAKEPPRVSGLERRRAGESRGAREPGRGREGAREKWSSPKVIRFLDTLQIGSTPIPHHMGSVFSDPDSDLAIARRTTKAI